MKNILVGDIKPKYDEGDVQVIDPPCSSNVPQNDDKDERVENEDTHCNTPVLSIAFDIYIS